MCAGGGRNPQPFYTGELSMSGTATGFTAVALQSDEFAESEHLRDPIFSGLAVDETGRVSFTSV